eukprot:CAMPEP_0170893632 /NCGR_PEP_ID=MMETSP0734-20130129/42556_1 /TAXON_ID=186038 /ORGANISM="Fragilariopsis kerguelensis, Strain L26-C5" /LENGTH=430 /DNA_ID=CAMNT_0011284203 /DNA_START=203 /DNA_END=1495 /DNA_ORIENTATION=-
MNQKGYDPNFLGSSVPAVPLPSFSNSLHDDVLERDTLSSSSSGVGEEIGRRRIYRHYHHHTIVMSKTYRTALFAALTVDQSQLEKTDHTAGWRIDEAVGADHQLNGEYYTHNVWDRGHLAPDATAGWGNSADRITATNDTYYYTNATLQHENFNRDEWKDLEQTIRSWPTHNHRLSEITGPIFVAEHGDTDADAETIQPEGRERATIPAGFFKVVAYVSSTSSSSSIPVLQVRCFVIYQDAVSRKDRGDMTDHQHYQVSVTKLEQVTGLVFDPVYHEANRNFDKDEDDVSTPLLPPPPHLHIMEGGDHNTERGGICIAAVMVNPVGKDSGNEWITIVNRTNKTVNLERWKLVDQKGRELVLSSSLLLEEEEAELEAGITTTVQPISPLRLVNSAGSLTLFNEAGDPVDHVSYTKHQVQEGVAIDFFALNS